MTATFVTVWLLLNLGGNENSAAAKPYVIERFQTVQECQRVNDLIAESVKKRFSYDWRVPPLQCVQATVVLNK